MNGNKSRKLRQLAKGISEAQDLDKRMVYQDLKLNYKEEIKQLNKNTKTWK